MTSNVELLPLPETIANWLRHMKVASGNDGSMETFLRWFEDYARANVAHATAAKDAEIEALRAERDEARRAHFDAVNRLAPKADQAERLAEALREIEVLSPLVGVSAARTIARAALHPTTTTTTTEGADHEQR